MVGNNATSWPKLQAESCKNLRQVNFQVGSGCGNYKKTPPIGCFLETDIFNCNITRYLRKYERYYAKVENVLAQKEYLFHVFTHGEIFSCPL